jgi:hypothetical protein
MKNVGIHTNLLNVIVDEAADVEEALTEARRHLAERLLASFST